MHKADILLALVAIILAAWLAIILLRRKANREFPFFSRMLSPLYEKPSF